jgi:hypothetical protein
MTPEEYAQLQADRKQKQAFLKTNVIQAGYKPKEFQKYIVSLKEYGKPQLTSRR